MLHKVIHQLSISTQHFELQNQKYIETANHIYENEKKLSLDKLMEKDEIWIKNLSNELS